MNNLSDTSRRGSSAGSRGWLKAEARAYRQAVQKLVALALAKFVCSAGGFFLLAHMLAEAVLNKQRPAFALLMYLLICFICQYLLQWLLDRGREKLAQDVLDDCQARYTDILRQHSLAIIRDYSLAEWQSLFLRRLPALQAYFAEYLPQQAVAVLVPLAVLAFTLPHSWLALLLLAIAAPLIPLFMWLVGQGAASAQRRNFKALERLGSIFLDRLKGRQLLFVHNAVEAQHGVFIQASHAVRERTMAVLKLAFLSSSVLDFFATVGLALVAVFVGFSLLGEIDFGSWQSGLQLSEGVFILLLAPAFFAELKTLGRLYHLRADALAAAHSLQHIQRYSGEQPRPLSAPVLSLQNVTLARNDGTPLLHSPSLVLESSSRVLLQGASGSGKTTLLEALLGMRPKQYRGGTVLPRDQVAWLSQDAQILPGSVRDNITLGERASDAYLTSLLEKVGMGGWLRQQRAGLSCLLGDHPPLSGGQQQRLAIARLLFFNKPIVFLDEPTASLSGEQEARITHLLQAFLADKTLIWIAHDLGVGESFFTSHWRIDEQTGRLDVRELSRQCCA